MTARWNGSGVFYPIQWDLEVEDFLSRYEGHPKDLNSHAVSNALARQLTDNYGRTSDSATIHRNRIFSLRVKLAAGWVQNNYGVLVWEGGE